MPLNTLPGRPLYTHYLYEGESLELQHSYVDWLAKRGLTATSVTVTYSQAGIATFAQESFSGGILVGSLTANQAGTTHLILTLRAGTRTKVTVFEVCVADPEAA